MIVTEIIERKRDGLELSRDEIYFIINGYTDGNIPDYQISAFLMAVYLKGMSQKETVDLTMSMVSSGDQLDLSSVNGIKVDKHSTGGVGDKTTLIIAPLVASCGVPFAKMSGRGLGHTGGTIDKLESIKGFNVSLSKDQFVSNVNDIGLSIIGQMGNLVPADKKIYSLRDVTGTVNSIPLITSSIMSKKIASGADAILLDVKVGNGAFMKNKEDAVKLAEAMVNIGNSLNKRTVAVLTSMDEPLGSEVGNANEVKEVVEILKGKVENDLLNLSLILASHIVVMGNKANTLEEAESMLRLKIKDGSAYEKFVEMVELQNGDINSLTMSDNKIEVVSRSEGYVNHIDAEIVGRVAMLLGAGRSNKEDIIDHGAGITLHKKIGDRVAMDEAICTLYTNRTDPLHDEIDSCLQAYQISQSPPTPSELILEIIK